MSPFPSNRMHMLIAVLIVISSLLVGVGSTVAMAPIGQTIESADMEPSRLLQQIIDQRHLLTLAAVPAFLIGVALMFTDRYRAIMILLAITLLLLPVAAVIYGFITLLAALYSGESAL